MRAAFAIATDFYVARLTQREAAPARRYLSSRAIPVSVAREAPWRVGYALEARNALYAHLLRHGFGEEDVLDAGLAFRGRRGGLVDLFRGRVVFPVRDADGYVVSFLGRVPDDSKVDAANPKWMNTRNTLLYTKSQILYGLAEQLHRYAEPRAVLVVEGPSDVMAVARLPEPWLVVAPCGTALTSAHLATLTRAVPAKTPLLLAFDGDASGQKAAAQAYELVRGWVGPVDAVVLPPKHDPASLVAAVGPRRAVEQLVATRRPLIDLPFENRIAGHRLDEIEGRVMAMRAGAAFLRDVADHVPRDHTHVERLTLDLARRAGINPVRVVQTMFPPDEPKDSTESSAANAAANPREPPQHAAECPGGACGCSEWNWYSRYASRPELVRIDGVLYLVKYGSSANRDRRRQAIRYSNGRTVTVDLHAVGTVPEAWRQWLPNNAGFGNSTPDRQETRKSAAATPDLRTTGHDYAHRAPATGPSAIRVQHNPDTGHTAWVVATATTATPRARRAARYLAEVAVRAAVLVGAEQAVSIAREALLDTKEPSRADAALTVVTTFDGPHPAPGSGKFTVASAGDNHSHALIQGSLLSLSDPSDDVGGFTYRTEPGDTAAGLATRFLGDASREHQFQQGISDARLRPIYQLPADAIDHGARTGATGPSPEPDPASARPASGIRHGSTRAVVLSQTPEAIVVTDRTLAASPASVRLRTHLTPDRGPAESPVGRRAADYIDSPDYPADSAALVIRPRPADPPDPARETGAEFRPGVTPSRTARRADTSPSTGPPMRR
ncbi:toprim domain-containing protein [Cryptosporangium sp. NPDC051539]|uniref:toprim domain-containing protein n=1 Tax=Cryptosporangium sp. NPDC051539 TaxID=3363962 RepID=UPI0037B9F023